MRRKGTQIGIIAVILVGIVVTGFVAYGRGETAGQNAAASDRSAFGQPRGTSVAGGQGGQGGQGGSGTGGGSAAAGGQRTGGAGGQNGGGAASAVAGKVTKVDSGTLTLQQQPGNTTATVMTSTSTMVTTFAPGALSDLKMGDVVALQGDKTGDTAFTAKTIYALTGAQGRGASGRTPGGTDTAARTPAAGNATGGGRNQAGGAGGSAPAGAAGGGGTLFPGLNGPTGRITKIDTGTLTLQGFDGSTTTVTTNASTSVRKETTGAVSDIKVGDTISVQSDPTGNASAPARAIIDLGTGT